MLRLTERAQKVVRLAVQLARRTGAAAVAEEHLLLGLLRLGEGMGNRILREMEADRATLEGHLRLPPATTTPPAGGPLPFTPAARALLVRQAVREAQAMGHRYLGTEHLLLALTQGDTGAARALAAAGVTPERARATLRRILDETHPA